MTFVFFRLKDGLQACPRCGGQGCWGCEREGVVIQCPGCANTHHFEKRDDDILCLSCGAAFTKAGVVQRYEDIDAAERARKKERQDRLRNGKSKPSKMI